MLDSQLDEISEIESTNGDIETIKKPQAGVNQANGSSTNVDDY